MGDDKDKNKEKDNDEKEDKSEVNKEDDKGHNEANDEEEDDNEKDDDEGDDEDDDEDDDSKEKEEEEDKRWSSFYLRRSTCSMEETLASSRHSSVAASSRSFSSIPDPWKHVGGFAALGMFTDRDRE